MHERTGLITAALGLSALLALQACALLAPRENDELAAKIEHAKTPADHAAIAALYEKRAAEAEQEAERHRKMEKSYAVGASTGRVGLTPLPQHCAAIARRYDAIAREYATLAATERQLARTAR